MAAAGTPELVAEFDRLKGTNLSMHGSQLDLMIDKSTGRMRSDMIEFLNFVYDVIFLPLQQDSNENLREL